jgi:hypothetical protein
VRLPDAYRTFLLSVALRAGDFLAGSDFDIGVLERIQFGAQHMATESGVVIPPGFFTFLSHQGYQYLLFPLTPDDDPPVFYLGEQDREPRALDQRFSEWLASAVEEELPEARG